MTMTMKNKVTILSVVIAAVLLSTQPVVAQKAAKAAKAAKSMTTTATTTTGATTSTPKDNSEKIIIVKVQEASDIQNLDEKFDVLSIDEEGGEVTILADSRDEANLEKEQYPFQIDEVATLDLAKASAAAQVSGDESISPTFFCYRTVEETNAAAEAMAMNYPNLAEYVDIGDSWEKVNGIDGDINSPGGYDLYALKLTNNNISVPGGKPIFFASCSIHAREYTPQELCTRFAETLVEGYGIDADKTALLDYHEVHLVLVGNPDARKEAEDGKSWRKNKNNDEAECDFNPDRRGVDLNRNFPFNWAAHSGSVCDNTYSGPSAESEPETIAILDYMRSIFPPNQRVFAGTTTLCNDACGDLDPSPATAMGVGLDIHSSGKDYFYPWGYSASGQACGNLADFRTFARRMAFYNDHIPGFSSSEVRGTAKDTYYGDFGIAAYTVELGTEFFEDCSYFEDTLLPDNLKALEYAAKVSRMPFLTPYGPDVVNLSLDQPGPFIVGQSVTLTAVIDDGQSSTNGDFPVSSPQNIASATMYVDLPPWDTNAASISMIATGGSFGTSTQQDVQGTIDTDQLQLAVGRHTIYVVGTDTDGNEGPFSALFLELVTTTTTTTTTGATTTSGSTTSGSTTSSSTTTGSASTTSITSTTSTSTSTSTITTSTTSTSSSTTTSSTSVASSTTPSTSGASSTTTSTRGASSTTTSATSTTTAIASKAGKGSKSMKSAKAGKVGSSKAEKAFEEGV